MESTFKLAELVLKYKYKSKAFEIDNIFLPI